MPSLKKSLLPIVVIALGATLLVPSLASAQKSCQPAGSPRCQNLERFQEKREQLEKRRDAARGVTPACRAAYDRWKDAVQARARATAVVNSAKADVKSAKGKKAKAKRKKALKKAKAKLKKAKAAEARLLAARGTGCQGSTVPTS